MSILLSSFSKEELLDYNTTPNSIKTPLKSLLEKMDLGRLILPLIMAPIPRFGLFRQPQLGITSEET